jgi:hypothetical protein
LTVCETFLMMLSVKLGISFCTSLWTKAWTSSCEIIDKEDYWLTKDV